MTSLNAKHEIISDEALDAAVAKLSRADRERAEKAAQAWRDETALDLVR